MFKRFDEKKAIEKIKKQDILVIKKIYKYYKKYILENLSKEKREKDVILNVLLKAILNIESESSLKVLIDENINLANANNLSEENFTCIEDLQKTILSKWIDTKNVKFAYVFYSSPINMVYDGNCDTLQSIIIKDNSVEITKYSRDFEVFHFSDYPMPYISSLDRITRVGGKNNIVIMFEDDFMFCGIPNMNKADSKKIQELKEILIEK